MAEFARIWPDLREICANLRKSAQVCEIVFAIFSQICAKFTAPFVTVPFVPFQLLHSAADARRTFCYLEQQILKADAHDKAPPPQISDARFRASRW